MSLLCKRHQSILHNDSVFIDGIALSKMSKTDWYWTNSGKKINYEMEWGRNQPNFQNQNQWCLSLDPESGYKFNDLQCQEEVRPFICQKVQKWCSKSKEQIKDVDIL